MGWVINLPFTKRYRVKCPDGSIKIIYKKVDEAFPLFIPGWKGDITADIKAFEQVPASVKAAYESKIQGLLFSLDDRNQSLMITFRTVYLLYMSDPCSNGPLFARQIEKIVEEQRQLALLKIRIGAFIELVKAQPKAGEAILLAFNDIVQELGGGQIGDAAAIEIEGARRAVRGWIGGR